jgi:hypothetical protein
MQLITVAGLLRCAIALGKAEEAKQFDAYLRVSVQARVIDVIARLQPAASGMPAASNTDAKRKPLPQVT